MFWYILVICEMFINILGWHRVPSRSSPETMEMFHCHGTAMCKAWQGRLLGPKIWTLEQALGARWNQQLPKWITGILSNTLIYIYLSWSDCFAFRSPCISPSYWWSIAMCTLIGWEALENNLGMTLLATEFLEETPPTDCAWIREKSWKVRTCGYIFHGRWPGTVQGLSDVCDVQIFLVEN